MHVAATWAPPLPILLCTLPSPSPCQTSLPLFCRPCLTCTSGRPSDAPSSVQVRSLPPLPSVVMAPVCSPFPRKPVTTSTLGVSPSLNVRDSRSAGSDSS